VTLAATARAQCPVESVRSAAPIVHLQLRPDHVQFADRLVLALRAALTSRDAVVVPLPPGDLTVVDRGWHAPLTTTMDGRVITVELPWLEPARASDVEVALASALARAAWSRSPMLTTYAARRILRPMIERQLQSTDPHAFLLHRFFGGFVPFVNRSIRADAIPPDRSALALDTLGGLIGSSTLDSVIDEFARRFGCRDASTSDFASVAETASGRDLQWFFSQAYDPTIVFDYAVAVETRIDAEAPLPHRTTVTVRRIGDGVWPSVPIRLRFGDGAARDEVWDGRAGSTRLTFDSAAPIDSAIVDPDEAVALDATRANNSWTHRPRVASAAVRSSAIWITWLADLLATYAFFA
jgi:hypothetical protein